MDALQAHTLQILSTQAQDYLISPNAASFIGAGLDDPDEVLRALKGLEADGLAEYYIVETDFRVEGEEELTTEVTDEGWIITDKGRKALA